MAPTLKAWIDHAARRGKTFRYTPAGPEGLLRRHILTPAGHRLVAVMRQRAETRARLIADKPARALTPEIAR